VTAAPAGFGVTLDLDAIDPLLAPGVGSPEPEGLNARDVLEAVSGIAGLPDSGHWKSSSTTRIAIGLASRRA
jgi:hypothetical protein